MGRLLDTMHATQRRGEVPLIIERTRMALCEGLGESVQIVGDSSGATIVMCDSWEMTQRALALTLISIDGPGAIVWCREHQWRGDWSACHGVAAVDVLLHGAQPCCLQ